MTNGIGHKHVEPVRKPIVQTQPPVAKPTSSLRERFQRERPSLAELQAGGDAAEVVPQGEYLDLRVMLATLKKHRGRQHDAADLRIIGIAVIPILVKEQWCSDWYSRDYYRQSASSDPFGPSAGPSRVFRGGSWERNSSHCRSAYRIHSSRSSCIPIFKFRVVVEVVSKTQPAPTSVDDAFIKKAAALPAEQRVALVVAKLMEHNLGYDAEEEHVIEKGTDRRNPFPGA